MLFFFHRHSSDKIYSLKLYHLLNVTLHSKANALNIGTCFRFYMQMRVEKKTKAFAYRIYSHFTQQWTSRVHIINSQSGVPPLCSSLCQIILFVIDLAQSLMTTSVNKFAWRHHFFFHFCCLCFITLFWPPII